MKKGSVLLIIWLAVIFGWLAFYKHLSITRPTHPVDGAGQIYELNDHGHKAYVTLAEATVVYATFPVLAILVFGGGYAARKRNWKFDE